MKCCVSNIAWSEAQDKEIYLFLRSLDITALEIAPSRLFGEEPYECIEQARQYAGWLKEQYGVDIVSMQSIWYGRKENMFASAQERGILAEYTKKAIAFAGALRCRNLVFGCPLNRKIGEGKNREEMLSIAADFFLRLGEYAAENGVVLAMEANPAIYGTDFLNTTAEGIAFLDNYCIPEDRTGKREIKGLGINLDTGTILANGEELNWMDNQHAAGLVSHVHFSEPGLKKPERRELHRQVALKLLRKGYAHYFSVEMKSGNTMEEVKETILYLKQLAGEAVNG